MSSEASSAEPQSNGRLALTSLAALGVVFGDIGTSPLYTLKTVLDYTGPHPDPAATLGALSLILWTLFLVTTVKYVNFAMRIDNDGEGGIVALMTLLGVKRSSGRSSLRSASSARRSSTATARLRRRSRCSPRSKAWSRSRQPCRPTCCPRRRRSCLLLFAVQPFGTAAIGRAFGPIMLAWFAVIAALGAYGVMQHPSVIAAVNPLYGLDYLSRGGFAGISRARRRVPLRHRRRGALCRHGAFRAQADPPVMELYRLSGPHSQLCRTGRDRARRRANRGQHLLPALPWAAADAADLAGDSRDRHRQPVDHHRRLFDDPPGDAARLAAAHDDHPDLGGGLWPDLYRHGQLAVDDRHPWPDDRLRQIRQSRRRLRHRRVRDHADDERAVIHRHARDLALAGRGRGGRRGAVPHHRRRLFLRQHGQGDGRRLGSRSCWLRSSTA